MTLRLDDHLTACRYGDLISLRTPGSEIILTEQQVEDLHHWATDQPYIMRYAAPPTSELNWVE